MYPLLGPPDRQAESLPSHLCKWPRWELCLHLHCFLLQALHRVSHYKGPIHVLFSQVHAAQDGLKALREKYEDRGAPLSCFLPNQCLTCHSERL